LEGVDLGLSSILSALQIFSVNTRYARDEKCVVVAVHGMSVAHDESKQEAADKKPRRKINAENPTD